MNKNSEVIKDILFTGNDKLTNKVFSPVSLLLLLSIVRYFVEGEERDEVDLFLEYFNL